MSYGGFYNGTKLSTNIGINYRIQPKANFGISYNLDLIKLKEGYGEDQFNRLAIKAEFFSAKIIFHQFYPILRSAKSLHLQFKITMEFCTTIGCFLGIC